MTNRTSECAKECQPRISLVVHRILLVAYARERGLNGKMMKLILFITALLALVCSNKALQCYYCRTPDLVSSDHRFNNIPLCDNDFENSKKVNTTGAGFGRCKKILEQIKRSDKEETLIIRTYVNDEESLNLDTKIFTEYDCKTDLCNTGSYATPAWLTLFLSIPLLMTIHI